MKAHNLDNPHGIAPKRAGMPSPLWVLPAPTKPLAARLFSGLSTLFILFTLGLSGQAQAQGEIQPETLSLVCDPCTATKSAPTSISITAGVRNSGAAASRKLQLAIGAFASPQAETGVLIARVPLSPVPRSSSVASKEYTTWFRFPHPDDFGADGNTHLILYLQEFVTISIMGVSNSYWTTRDVARLSPSQPLANPPAGGESIGGLYIEGAPSVDTTTTAGMVAVTIPKLVNSGEESVTLTDANLVHSHVRQISSDVISATGGAVTLNPAVTIPPGGVAANVSFTGTYVNPVNASVNNGGSTTTETFDYTHLLLTSASREEIWINVRNDSGTALPNTHFTANTIDFLNDEDADGVTDHSETLAGTDPAQAASKPETLNIDVMVVYTAALETAENDEPMTRIMRDVAWANMALENSGIDARYRVVHYKDVAYTERNFNKMLIAMERQTAPFVGIDDEREAVGADLLVLYTHSMGKNNRTCGLASTPGTEREGDMAFYSRVRVVAAVSAPCHASILAHELGHNLGLAHSERQGSIGTWEWSRGHGVVNSFVTVMAYPAVYRVRTGNTKQIYSNPDKSECGSGANGSGTAACGVARTMPKSADATRSIKATMFQIAQLSPTPPDTDKDGVIDNLDAFPNDPTETVNTDDDDIGNNADPDDDNDGLTDIEEAALGTNPLLADTDGDTVNDKMDAFPLDATETTDTDGDKVGDNADAFPNDASETADSDNDGVGDNADAFPNDPTETVDTDGDRIGNNADPDDDNDGLTDEEEAALGTNPLLADTDGDTVNDGRDAAPLDPLVSMSLPIDATKPANVIADFDDPSAIRADTAGHVLTGVFADNSISHWSVFDPQGGRSGVAGAVRVGTASVSTWQIGGADKASATGSIRINGVTLNSRYINFLMTGGGSGADVGMVAMIAGTNHALAAWIPTTCSPRHLTGEENWSHFDMHTHVGQTVDLLIYDNDSANDCGFVSLDHIYQSDTAQGTWRSRAPLSRLTGPRPCSP